MKIQKGFSLVEVIIAAGFIALLGIGIFYFISKNSFNDEILNTTVTNEDGINTDTWKILSGTDLGYTLKYPGDWEVLANRARDLSIKSEEGEIISVFTRANDKNLHLRTWLYQEFPSSVTEKFILFTYGENQAYLNSDSGIAHLKLYNNRILTIAYTNYLGGRYSMGTKHIQEFKQILASINIYGLLKNICHYCAPGIIHAFYERPECDNFLTKDTCNTNGCTWAPEDYECPITQ